MPEDLVVVQGGLVGEELAEGVQFPADWRYFINKLNKLYHYSLVGGRGKYNTDSFNLNIPLFLLSA